MRKNIIILILSALGIWLLSTIYTCFNPPQFTRDIFGYDKWRADRHSDWVLTTNYHEYIYINDCPQDTLEQLKLMLWYVDKNTNGFQTPRKMKNKEGDRLTSYTIWFSDINRREGETSFAWAKRRHFTFGTKKIGHVSFRPTNRKDDNMTNWELSVKQPYNEERDGKMVSGSHHFGIFDEGAMPKQPIDQRLLVYHEEEDRTESTNDRLSRQLKDYYEVLQYKRR